MVKAIVKSQIWDAMTRKVDDYDVKGCREPLGDGNQPISHRPNWVKDITVITIILSIKLFTSPREKAIKINIYMTRWILNN